MMSMTLPMYMLAITPQNTSGHLRSRSGPGVTPWSIIAASIRARTLLVGMPSVRRGTKPPAVAALFAVSGPATPSMAPCPNSSGRLATRFSSA